MEIFLEEFLPSVLPGVEFEIQAFEGKQDLLTNLENRLRGYRYRMTEDWRLFVMVDRDNDDCHALKSRLENASVRAGLHTRARSGAAGWQVANRIVIEELEAWYFGDWEAVQRAYEKVSPTAPKKAPYRDPDAVRGGTWEAFQRVMRKHGYFRDELGKVEAARAIAPHMDPARNRSGSFAVFRDALFEAAGAAPAP